MNGRQVHLESIDVTAARGIRHGEGFAVEGLSAGINLVWGPNGSGKSTMALAIEAVLWPNAMRLTRPTLRAAMRHGEERWTVEIDAGVAGAVLDGARRDVPTFAPTESRHRHHLALPDLIADSDAEFAKRIADAGRGGFDLDAAATALGLTARPSVPQGLRKSLDQTDRALSAAQRTQENLVAEERKLVRARERLERARAASLRRSRLEMARRWRRAADECERVAQALAALPAGVHRLRGDERQRLDELRTRKDELEAGLRRWRAEVAEAERLIRDAALPKGGVDEQAIACWRNQIATLRQEESQQRERRRAAAGAAAAVDECRRQIGEGCTDAVLEALGPADRRALSGIAQRALRVAAAEAALAERRRLLDASTTDAPTRSSPDALHDAVGALGRWLAAPDSPGRRPPDDQTEARRAPAAGVDPWLVALAAMSLLAAAIVALAFIQSWWWLIALVLCAVLFVFARGTNGTAVASPEPSRRPPDERAVHRGTFERTRLDPPAEWEVGAVAERLEELLRLQVQHARAVEVERARAALEAEVASLDSARTDLDAERLTIARRLGIPLSTEIEWLGLFVAQLERWQEARTRSASAQEELESGRRAIDTVKTKLLRAMEQAVGKPPHDAAAASAASADELGAWIDAVARREQRRSAATEILRRAAAELGELQVRLAATADEVAAIFRRGGLEDGDDAMLDEWLARLPERDELQQTLAAQAAIRDDCRRQLLATSESNHPEAAISHAATPHAATPDAALADLIELDGAAIEQAIADAAREAETQDEILTEILRVEHDIERAKGGVEITDLLAERERIRAALADAFESAADSLVGHRLVEWVRQVEGDRSRPAVFRRASELLAIFTRGALALELRERDGAPAFLARRSSSDGSGGGAAARPLEELSCGERVQLLIAVRLAFIEQEEQARLPLVIDEALATSDDERIAIIIDTVIEIARSGRQVFCFTAQRDEIARWKERLEAADAPHRIIDLAEVRGLARARAVPWRTPPDSAAIDAVLPAPGDDDWLAYGRRLDVPGIDPRDEPQGGLHLWHLIEDPVQLHGVLSRGIRTWGQMRMLIEHRAEGALGLDAASVERAHVVAAAIVRAGELWRVGRGAPVDRAALSDAGGISQRFLDRVVALAAERGGDAASLIERIREGALRGWRQDNTDILREWLIEHGHLDESPRLTTEELRLRLLAACAADLERGALDHRVITRIVDALPLDAAAPAEVGRPGGTAGVAHEPEKA